MNKIKCANYKNTHNGDVELDISTQFFRIKENGHNLTEETKSSITNFSAPPLMKNGDQFLPHNNNISETFLFPICNDCLEKINNEISLLGIKALTKEGFQF